MYRFGVFFERIIAFLTLSAIFLCSIYAAPDISASSAVMINADTGEIIFEHEANKQRGMASTTKIMTAIIAIENGELDKKVLIPDTAIGVEGSSLYLKSGESMTMRELIIGLMLRSANDAAEAIAILTCGSVNEFADLMNQKAKDLGLKSTHFTNPHGLSDDNHYTTARDLAMLTAYALKNDTFHEICSTANATLPGERYVTNHNKLLSMYDGAYGVKTGFTKATGRCLVSAAKRDNVNLIVVTLNAPDDWNDHRALLDYGFSLFESVKLANCGDLVYSVPVVDGESDKIDLYIKDNLFVCLKKNRGSIVEHIEIILPRFAPIYKGDVIGKIIYKLDGKEIASSPLCASKYIGIKYSKNSLLNKISNILK